jgi:predicted nucleic acid-binding protein
MPTAPTFLDTNVILRHLLGDNPDQAARARALLLRVEAGEVRVRIAETVVFELVFTLQRIYKKSPREIRDALLPILDLPAISLPGKSVVREALRLYVEADLPFADAYHAALMAEQGISEIYTFDRHFDRCPGIHRREP